MAVSTLNQLSIVTWMVHIFTIWPSIVKRKLPIHAAVLLLTQNVPIQGSATTNALP